MKFYKRLILFAVFLQVFVLLLYPFVIISEEELAGKIALVFINIFGIDIMTFLIIYYKTKIAEITFQDEYVFLTQNDKTIIKELKSDCSEIYFKDFEGKIVMQFENRKYIIQKYYSITYKPIFDFSILNNQNFPNAVIKK